MTYWCELLVSQGANFGELRFGEVRILGILGSSGSKFVLWSIYISGYQEYGATVT